MELAQLALHGIRVDAALSHLGFARKEAAGREQLDRPLMLEMGRKQLHRRH